jgi:hypothetical protein
MQDAAPPISTTSSAGAVAPLALRLLGLDLGWWPLTCADPCAPIARDALRALAEARARSAGLMAGARGRAGGVVRAGAARMSTSARAFLMVACATVMGRDGASLSRRNRR